MNRIPTPITKILALLFVTVLLQQPLNAQETVDRVVAVVNDDIITLSELSEMALSLNPTSSEALNDRELLDKMIEQKLFEQEAEKRGITVSEAELDASVEGVRQRYNLNEEQMNEVLKKQGLTPEAFREQWRAQTLGNKLLESQLKNKIVVTDDEIRRYYERNYLGTSSDGSALEEEEVRIAHIMISYNTENASQLADQVADLAKSGEDFDNLAEKFSDDTSSADNGGDLGYFKKGDLIDSMEYAVVATPVGSVTGPVESPAGYHIIKVLERTEPDYETGSDDEELVAIDDATKTEIHETLMREKAQAQLKTWLESIRENAYIENKY